MTDAEKLEAIRELATGLYPVYRIAIAVSPTTLARNEGYDQAMHETQKKLLEILNN